MKKSCACCRTDGSARKDRITQAPEESKGRAAGEHGVLNRFG